MNPKAHLFGPFFGELSWEYFRFAPYAIHLKNKDPKTNIIVLTRSSRFDLYGQYADILVPLVIESDEVYDQKAFKLLGFEISTAQKIADIFRIQYKKKYNIISYNCPDFSSLRHNIRWQFPRLKMDYNFEPRIRNVKIVKQIYKSKNLVIADKGYTYKTSRYDVIDIEEFTRIMDKVVDNINITYMGCLIELLKKAKFVISTLTSDVGRMALLLNVPLIYPYRKLSTDKVLLLNPLKTPVIDCESIIEGVKIYEDNI